MSTVFTHSRLDYLLLLCVIPRCIVYKTHTHTNNNNKYSLLPLFPEMLILYYSKGVKSDWPFLFLPIQLFFTQVKGLGFRCTYTSCLKESSINNIEWLGNTQQPGPSEHTKSLGFHRDYTLPIAITDFFFRNIFKRIREILLFTTLRQLTDKGKFSRNINGMCRRKFILQKCYELAVNPPALPFEGHEQEWVGLGTGRNGKKKSGSYKLEPTSLPLPKQAGKPAKMQTILGCSLSSKQIALGAKGGHTWAGNSSLSFILFVCVKFPLCPHPFSHPVPCFVHPSIPSLCQCWLHPSSHNHIAAIARPQGTPPPRMPTATSRFQTVICWRRAQPAACRLLLHRPAKTLILNLIPIGLLFTFPTEGNGREKDTRREKRGGGEWGRIMERDVCWIF